MIFSPLLCELAGGGNREDGLAEALKDGWHAVEAFAAGVDACEDCVELVGDTLLLVEVASGIT
jgi:hypothetical protein